MGSSTRYGGVPDGTVDLARDRDLVERCQGGDRTAFDELYHRYHRRLFHFCLRRLHEGHEAEDAMQEAFTRAWRALPSFGGDRRFYPWLSVIAGNVCTDILRRRARVTPVDDVPVRIEDLTADDADARLIHEVDAAMAMAALGKLSPRHQRVLSLREGSGWSTQQIAESEGVAVPAVETLLWRARQALKREFAALAESGSRLGIGLGLAGAAFRRLLGRTFARSAAHVPMLQSFRSPGLALGSLALVGASVAGTAALVTTTAGSTPSSPAPAGSITNGGAGGAGAHPDGPGPATGGSGPAPTTGSPGTPAGGGAQPGGTDGAATGGGATGGGSSPAGLGGAVGEVGGTAGGAATDVGGAASDVGGAAGGALNDVGGVIDGVGGDVGGAGAAAGEVGGVVDGVGGTVGGLGGTADQAGGAVQDAVSGDPVTVPTVTVPTLPKL